MGNEQEALGQCETRSLEGPSERCRCVAEYTCLACDEAKCDGCMSGGMPELCLGCTERFREYGVAVVEKETTLPEEWCWQQGLLAVAAEKEDENGVFRCYIHDGFVVFDFVGKTPGTSATEFAPVEVVRAVLNRD